MAELKIVKIKASTLLEVIIAMVIILVVFTLAIGVYNNVLRSSPSIKKEQVKALTDQVIEQSIKDEQWEDEDITIEGITIKKIVLPYETYKDLIVITATAFENGQQTGQSKRVVKKDVYDYQ